MTKIDILLINPPPQPTTIFLPIPPLGLAGLASIMENNGFETKILDMGAEMLKEKELLKKIERWQPKLIGFTSTSPTIPLVVRMARMIKKEFDIPICIGGPHATFDLTFLQNFRKFFDYQVVGEGEYVFLWLCRKVIREKKKVKEIIHGKPVENLDCLPFPAYHLLPMEKYPKIGAIKGSRGCPYRCIFCCVNSPYMRFRSPEHIIEEIKFLHEKYKIKFFEFDDENFTLNKKFANEICNRIKKEKLDITWGCQNRCDLVDSEILKKMVNCGARSINFGVETFSERLQKILRKNLSLNSILNSISLAREVGLKIGIYCLFGLPMEKKEEVQLTFRYLQKIKPDVVNLSLIVPYPGTEIFNFLVKKKKIDKDVWHKYAKAEVPMPICFSENFSRFLYTKYFLKTFLDFQRTSQIIFHTYTPFLLTFAHIIKQYPPLFFFTEKLWISMNMYSYFRPFIKKFMLNEKNNL